MAVVYEVEHTSSKVRRALKWMRSGPRNEELVRRFWLEYRTLARLQHPGVPRVFEAGRHGDRPYFVMELIAGRSLREEMATWDDLPPAERFGRARNILIQIAHILVYVHRAGVVHRDVTPANVMIQPDGSTCLMDFGVVKAVGDDLTTAGDIIGTIAYSAPEQSCGERVDARADLYSLGAIYYEMLTGRRPFRARTLAGYINEHLTRSARPPRELSPDLGLREDRICLRLLAKRPGERFASATHLLHELQAFGRPGPSPQSADWNPALAGRLPELTVLREATARLLGDQIEAGRGGVVSIEAAPGMGASDVIDAFVGQVRGLGMPICRFRSRSPTQPSFSGFRPLFDALATTAADHPALASTFWPEDAPTTVERWAVMHEMGRLVAAGGPRVVVLEDFDRADGGTIELADHLVRHAIASEEVPLLMVITRSRQPGAAALGAVPGVSRQQIALGPLSVSSVEELLLGFVAWAPEIEALARRLHAAGEGSPFFISEMMRRLIERRVILSPEAEGWWRLTVETYEVTEGPLPVPSTLRGALLARIQPLDALARSLLLALALTREQLDVRMLAAVAGVSPERCQAALMRLVSDGLVRMRDGALALVFELTQSRIQHLVIEESRRSVRMAMHRALAEWLERSVEGQITPVVQSLAWHFEQGAVPQRAFIYQIKSAEILMRGGFLTEAMAYLERAHLLEPVAQTLLENREALAQRARLALVRAEVLFHLGEWSAGEASALRAERLARELSSPELGSRTSLLLARHARRLSMFDDAERWLRRAGSLAEQSHDVRLGIGPCYEMGAVAWSRGELERAREYFARSLSSAEAVGDGRSLALGYNGMGLIALCRGQSAESRQFFERSAQACERYGLMERLAISRTNLVEVHHLTGNLRKGLELADRAVRHTREIHHQYGLALALRYRAMILGDLGRLVEAIVCGEEALRIQADLDNSEERLATLVMLLRVLTARGDRERAEVLMDEALALIGYDTEGFAAVIWAWRARMLALSGHLAQTRESIERACRPTPRPWLHQNARLQLGLARAHEALGQPELAAQRCAAALQISTKCGYRYYTMRAQQIAARVLADPVQASRSRRQARALARSLAADLSRANARSFLQMQRL